MPSSALRILFQQKQFLEPYPCHAFSHLKCLNYILHCMLYTEHVHLGCPEFLRPAFSAPQPIQVKIRSTEHVSLPQ